MKRKVVSYTSFDRAFKHITKRNNQLQDKIFTVIELLSENPFDNKLDTHKLKGILFGNYACTVEYDCRIVFSFGTNEVTNEEIIYLHDIGTHEDVY